jgi:hypothetical protein
MQDPTIRNLILDFGMIFLAVIFLMIWSIVWKALALWRSARLGKKLWFAVFLFVNTIGILEIIYLFVLSKPVVPAELEIKK